MCEAPFVADRYTLVMKTLIVFSLQNLRTALIKIILCVATTHKFYFLSKSAQKNDVSSNKSIPKPTVIYIIKIIFKKSVFLITLSICYLT